MNIFENANYFSPGQQATEFLPGDFILVHDTTLFAKLIQFGQSLRFYKDYAKWNHCAIVSDQNGSLIEATAKGIKQTTLVKYIDKEYILVKIQAIENDRFEAAAFARSCLNEGYGVFTFLSVAWSLLTGSRFAIGLQGQEICSGLVARSLERTQAIFPTDGSHMSPALLAKYYFPPTN